MMKQALEIRMKNNGDGTAKYQGHINPDLTDEEIFGLFEAILEMIYSNEHYSEIYGTALYKRASETFMHFDEFLKMIRVGKSNEVS